MHSWRSDPLRSRPRDAIGLDLDRALAEEPRFLLDGRFLGALHGEILQRLGREDAQTALLQLGFLHGMRDASRAVRPGDLGAGGVGSATPTRLGMRFARRRARATSGLEVRGTWPELREARAVKAVLGERPDPGCFASAGYTSGWLSALFQADILAVEQDCAASGAPRCRFVAREAATWAARRDARALVLLERLPFRELRASLADAALEPAGPPAASAFDPESPVVHVWGPVMVVPFAGGDETLQAIELIGQDPGARDVSVVVVDLAGALVDEGFGALALERVLAAVRSWGAEAILAGVSPLSEPVVVELASAQALVRKDLHEAIATAFQIADTTGRPV